MKKSALVIGSFLKAENNVFTGKSKVENGDPTVTHEYLELCAEVLGEPLGFFRRGECPRSIVSELVRVCLIAVFASYSAAWAAILRPWEI